MCNPTIVDSDPPDCALDAGYPHDPNDVGVSLGWDVVLITLDCEPPAVTPDSFNVSVGAPTVTSVDSLGAGVYRVNLSDVIPTPRWTCIEYIPSGQSVCLSHHPANANADLVSETADVSALIENLGDAAIPPLPTWQCDIDRSGECAPADVLGAIDLLNGSESFEVWQGITLHTGCPNAP